MMQLRFDLESGRGRVSINNSTERTQEALRSSLAIRTPRWIRVRVLLYSKLGRDLC